MKKIIVLLLSVVVIGAGVKANAFSDNGTFTDMNTQVTPYSSMPSNSSVNSELQNLPAGVFGSSMRNVATMNNLDPGDPIPGDLGDPITPISDGIGLLLTLGLVYVLFIASKRASEQARS
ncbi:hypothetical protein M2138_000764 [Dysgonomonadaceae bacterium PH5-43]|nr:hypothetical protein [Dysgonomonadaceae bacterium PH5-43]